MKKYTLGLGVALLFLGVVCCVVLLLQPSSFRVERRRSIAASPEALFAVVGDFQQWKAFSPWAHLDPQQKTIISQVSTGLGATFHWHSEMAEVGTGSMTIIEQDPPLALTIQLHFTAPFQEQYRTGFTLQPKDKTTEVIWWLEGQLDLSGRLAHLVLDFDTMLGNDFTAGLNHLADHVERASAQVPVLQEPQAGKPLEPSEQVPSTIQGQGPTLP